MSGFFNQGWPDVTWPVSRMERIGPPRPRDGKSTSERLVDLGGGQTMMIGERQFAEFMRRPLQMIPAEPGLHVIRCGTDGGPGIDGDQDWIIREPVIAWALCNDGEVRAVTPGGVAHDDERGVHVEYPKGIFGVGEYTDPFMFDSLEAMQAHFRPLAAVRAGDGQ